MISLLDKSKFYAAIPPIAKTSAGINFFIRFGGHYELVFNWPVTKPSGEFDPIMIAQLIDLQIEGPKKYVVPDLRIDAIKEGITTDYKLFRRLNRWVTDAIQTKKEVRA